jgi:PAS domain S-box-containing protein
MVGLPPDLPVDETTIPEYYPEEERSFASTVILKALLERGRWSGETHFRHWVTGQAIPVSDEHFMIFDPGGRRVIGMGTVTRDISGARRAAQEREDILARERLARQQLEHANAQLRAAEERFRLTIEQAPIGMALVCPDGRFARVNAALCELVGYTAEELQRMKFQDITHPEDLDADVTLHHRLVGGEMARYQFQKRYVRKDGRVVWASLSVALLRDHQGRPLYFISEIEDITERKRAEKEAELLSDAGALLTSSLDYERILATVGRLMVRDFADWCVVDIVEGGEHPRRLLVACADPARTPLAARLEQIRIDRRRPHFSQPVLEVGRSFLIERMSPEVLASFGQSAEHLEILRAIDPRSVMGVPLHVRDELLGVLVLMSSTTSHLYGLRDLRTAEALAGRAALAIENGRLYQAAVRATQLRDEVLGVVAHDLRNPMAAIMMNAASLRRRGEEPERRGQRARENIERAGDRMNHLISDLLDVSAIEAGQLGIERRRVSARQLLEGSAEAQRPLASSRGVELQLEIAGELPDVWGDEHRLLQVLENLVGNAIKFTPAGGRIIAGAAPSQGEILFWVADTGCGIPPEGVPHVFDRFWQAHRGARRGTGLGLPISRGIVEAHGGRIWVETTPGRGSIFFFTIPEAPAREAARMEAQP